MKTKKLSFFGKILSAMLVFAIIFIAATSAIAETPKNEEIHQTMITEEKTAIQPEQVKTSVAPEIIPPPAAALPESEKPAPSVNSEASVKPELISPLPESKLTAAFGVRFHPVTKEEMPFDHITLTAENDEIFAAASGVVKEIGYEGQKGNTLVLEHEGGVVTAYTHCSSFAVAKGDKVSQGDVIGYMGATGMATGKCLGFYVYVDGVACDPLDFIDIAEVVAIGELEIGD